MNISTFDVSSSKQTRQQHMMTQLGLTSFWRHQTDFLVVLYRLIKGKDLPEISRKHTFLFLVIFLNNFHSNGLRCKYWIIFFNVFPKILEIVSFVGHIIFNTHTHTHTYTYIYIWGEREKEKDRNYKFLRKKSNTHTYTHKYLHIYVCVSSERGKERERKESEKIKKIC